MSSSSSSSISKLLTPCQAKPEKKCVASEIGEHIIYPFLIGERSIPFKSCTSFLFDFEGKNRGKQKNHGFEEQSGSKSIIRSSYSGYTMKDLTSSSSGLRLPLPKMGFFDSVCFQRKYVFIKLSKYVSCGDEEKLIFVYNRKPERKKTENQMQLKQLLQTEEEDTSRNLRLLLQQKTAAFWGNAKRESENENGYILVLGALQGIVCILSQCFLLDELAVFCFFFKENDDDNKTQQSITSW